MRFSIATLLAGKHRDESDRLTLKDKMMQRDCEGIIAVDRASEWARVASHARKAQCLVQRTSPSRRGAAREIAATCFACAATHAGSEAKCRRRFLEGAPLPCHCPGAEQG